jgi:hypothetical protein
MQEQNFEKQVHKLMTDLEISPSPPVWDKVEQQIRKKKDRRRIAFWLLPFVLISTGFLWWLISTENMIEPSIPTDNITSSSGDNTSKVNELNKENPVENKPSILSDPSNNRTITPTNTIAENTNSSNSNIFRKKESLYQKDAGYLNIETYEMDNRKLIVPETASEKNNITNEIYQPPALKDIDTVKSETIINLETESKELVQDSSNKAIEPPVNEVAIEENIIDNQIKSANKTNWKIVPYIAGGFSNISKGLFEPIALADFAGTPGNTSGGGSGSGSLFSASVPQKNLYFSAGVRMVKSLNKHFEFSTGLQYSFFSTRTYTGTRVLNDTIISYSNSQVRLQDYYQNGNNNKYINNYHFISLPAAIEYQPLKNVPLSIQAGFSLNQLLSTNALLYNRNSNFQFENDKAWNKTQLHTFSGLQFHFMKSKSFSFKAGPFLQYSLTRLEKDAGKNQFLSVTGLQSQFYFNKTK